MRRRRPEPERRFEVYRRGGHSPEAALTLVLSSYGLSQNLVEHKPDGSVRTLHARWTLEEVNRITWMREQWTQGRIGGPNG